MTKKQMRSSRKRFEKRSHNVREYDKDRRLQGALSDQAAERASSGFGKTHMNRKLGG